jgi:hypothetical protein
VLSEPKARLTEWLSTDYNINAPERGGRAADTAHTQLGRPAHEAPTREYTHKHTQTHTNTRRGPTNKVRCGLTPWRRPLTHQRRAPRSLAPTSSELHHNCITVAISHAETMYVHRHRKALCLQREPRRRRLLSRSAAGLACSAPCPASVGRKS